MSSAQKISGEYNYVHPELPPKIYNDWSTMEARQRYSDEEWLVDVGYEDMGKFMDIFNFGSFKDAEQLINAFRLYPNRRHPGLLSILIPEPFTMNEEDWLTAAGYSTFKNFQTYHDLPPIVARQLLRSFRAVHQEVWIDGQNDIDNQSRRNLKKWAPRRGIRSLWRSEIEVVVEYHEGRQHQSLDELRLWAREARFEVPEVLKWFWEGDIPVCEYCEARGKAEVRSRDR